jgi:hypothetical protein
MQPLFNVCIVIGATACLVSPVAAQVRLPAQPTDFVQIQLLQNPSVQKELKLTDEQAGKLRELFLQNQEDLKEVWQKYPPEEAGTHWQAASNELRKGALAILDEAQKQRFWQIDVQFMTSFRFDSTTYSRADVVSRLGITAEQKKQLADIQAESSKKQQEAIKTPQQYQQKFAAAKKEDREQVAALLTKDQEKKWKELIGEPFTVVNAQSDLQAALRKWIRDDFAAAQAQARKTGKPIFLIFRCEP